MAENLVEKVGNVTVNLDKDRVSKDFVKVSVYIPNEIILSAGECTALEGDIANILPRLYTTFMPLDPRVPVPAFRTSHARAGDHNSFSGDYFGEIVGTMGILEIIMYRNMRGEMRDNPNFSFGLYVHCKTDCGTAVQQKIWDVIKPILTQYLVSERKDEQS